MPLHLTEAQLNEPVTVYARNDYATLYPEWTVSEALAHMRQHPPPGRIIYFYVVDDAMRLVGVVPTRRLLLATLETPIRDVMIEGVIAIPASATLLDACEFFTMHRLLAFPVVDQLRRLIGVIDIEAYAEELAETSDPGGPPPTRDDVFQLIGVRLTRAQQARPLVAFRGRFPWLLCNVAGGTLAAILAEIYQVELNWQHAVLALFIPVVLALAESVAIQSVTLALEAFREAQPSWRDLFARLRSEAATGLMLGLATGLLVGAIAAGWQGLAKLFLIVLGGIGIGVTCAAIVGLAVPHLLHLMKRDPQVAAGPIALTCADIAALLAYFNLARLLT
ncbi:Magnesium transporter MgtE [Gemmata obscuriglobus]|uniref:Magnesium transporter n=1 Tax=Gemmata obscuriglobus TaxID=114 RepID=A0A2Z3GY68_9BACT|nr:magnesium transporter [Gemmata obscuriglobus]AWM38368.1 magnesium transporter [Gemmata obscuriglobus]QEG28715.1 Magnesium transporter MgtE [Gemmata obscuriglobus]VTS06993.1 magnesium transporter : CBS domain containing protein OS=Pedosphaera parvula (strain Ellin514) GN=Cflav_PD3954 PE=4 SV=1: CBS: CBS: MgtE [Gemmata obscuriglobus UQM 2246]